MGSEDGYFHGVALNGSDALAVGRDFEALFVVVGYNLLDLVQRWGMLHNHRQLHHICDLHIPFRSHRQTHRRSFMSQYHRQRPRQRHIVRPLLLHPLLIYGLSGD